MKKVVCLFNFAVFSLFSQGSIFGQTFLNGSFETTKATCDYTVLNSKFSGVMSNCYAFGSASQIDIMRGSCGYGSSQQGTYFIGLAVDASNTLTDALSLQLSTPLIAGNNYAVSFYNKKHPDYDVNLLEVGYSSDSLSFGSIIGAAALPTTQWGLVSFSFTPTINCKFITIRTVTGKSFGWNFVDNFTISRTTSIINTIAEELEIQVFPNPTSNIISILPDNSTNIITTTIRDVQGKMLIVTDDKIIDLSDFGAGVFVMELNTNKGRIFKRIIRK